MKGGNNSLHMLAFLLVIVGGLNWGLYGAFNFNLVEAIFGGMPWLESFIYILVGLAAIYKLLTHGKHCKSCKMG
ncbi:MAG: DUF378 domain-containing protein [bacterium]|nr:DUF378 domain-containing protein [bacterium]